MKYIGNILAIMTAGVLYELTEMILERYKVRIIQMLYSFAKILLILVKIVPCIVSLWFIAVIVWEHLDSRGLAEPLILIMFFIWAVDATFYYILVAIIHFLSDLKKELGIEDYRTKYNASYSCVDYYYGSNRRVVISLF